MQTWQMPEAKARMSELVKCAQNQQQDIILHGKSVTIVVSRETFDRLSQTEVRWWTSCAARHCMAQMVSSSGATAA